MARLLSLIVIGFASLWGGLFLFYEQSDANFSLSYENPPMKYETVILPPDARRIPDIGNQKPLPNPPVIIKALYSTGWAAGGTKIQHLIDLAKATEINAVVIDIKDYSGVISYDIQVPEVLKYGAKEIRIPRINTLIKRLHDQGIYVIARTTVFQDPILAKNRPDLAIKNKTTHAVWKDNKGLSWIDPGAKDAWDYNIAIAKDAAARGFDEINFDYIRFPSDGDLTKLAYPFYDPVTSLKAEQIRKFFQYLRSHTEGIKISADLFGLTTINKDDMGIGQYIEYAYESFDYIAPMVYPSHYGAGFGGYKNPGQFPYEIVKQSMDSAAVRLLAYNLVTPSGAKLRPWLQDFSLGVTYGAPQVTAQIKAVYDSFNSDKLMGLYNGWMLWDPTNNYTASALKAE